MGASRVFLVEDEDLVAMLMEDILMSLGYELRPTAATLSEGLIAAEGNDFDIAILDVNLRGIQSFPIADLLKQRGIPFIFVSGYGLRGIETRFSDIPTLQKPFNVAALQKVLQGALTSGH